MLLLQLILYCLLFFLLVKWAAKDSGLNCIYFYPKEYINGAENAAWPPILYPDHRPCRRRNVVLIGKNLAESNEGAIFLPLI